MAFVPVRAVFLLSHVAFACIAFASTTSPGFAIGFNAVFAAWHMAMLLRRASADYRALAVADSSFLEIDAVLEVLRRGTRMPAVLTFMGHGGPAVLYLEPVPPGAELFVTEDHVPVLLDLARAGDEPTFRDLARSLGVQPDRLDEMWAGTRARAMREIRGKVEA